LFLMYTSMRYAWQNCENKGALMLNHRIWSLHA